MARMTGIDASFLYVETPSTHMHTVKVAVVQPTPGTAYGFERVRLDLASRMHLLPAFRRRLVDVPLGLHHPVWIEDPQFDLDRHLRRAQVAAPGGPREMDAIVSTIASTPLDRRRPLWELWVLEGLADGRVAAVGKVHHALADGVAVAAMLANVMRPELDELASAAPEPAWRPDPIPSRGRLLRDAIRDHGPQLRRLPALVGRSLRGLAAAARARREARVAAPMPVVDAPRTPFNGPLTPERAFASTSLPLDDVKRVGRVLGVTVNDVILALVAGALRRYLQARDGLPAEPLVVEVPVATDQPGAPPRLAGNRLSNIFTSLCTDVADPVARLRAIHDVMEVAKLAHRRLGPELFEAWMEYLPPRPVAWWMRLYTALRLARRHRPPINAIVSSVPGPRVPLGWSGGRLEAIYSVGPLVEGVPLNVTAWSYAGRLNVGVLVCPTLIPSPHAIAEGMHAAMDELLAAVPGARAVA